MSNHVFDSVTGRWLVPLVNDSVLGQRHEEREEAAPVLGPKALARHAPTPEYKAPDAPEPTLEPAWYGNPMRTISQPAPALDVDAELPDIKPDDQLPLFNSES